MEHPLILHESPDTYLKLIQTAATHRGIPAVIDPKGIASWELVAWFATRHSQLLEERSPWVRRSTAT